ncbi:hypothetical protein ACIHDR_43500 [Nocardia sp. NPDC052278]|uniref:hypothetical protein n=1 Tax=unclassified Nocardia TaxID=2637762 RepID=UPI00369A7E57
MTSPDGAANGQYLSAVAMPTLREIAEQAHSDGHETLTLGGPLVRYRSINSDEVADEIRADELGLPIQREASTARAVLSRLAQQYPHPFDEAWHRRTAAPRS